MQEEQVEAAHAESSTTARRTTRSSSRAAAEEAQKRLEKKGKKKKSKKDHDSDQDEANYVEGLNKSSARKGGHFEICEICGKRFLVRGSYVSSRLLCPACRKSVDKTQEDKAAVAKRARAAVAAGAAKRTKRRKMKKTADGLLEFEPGLPSLQDLCVRVIARHIDQVESFGDLTAESLNKLCRIISKMRILDEQTMRLFLGRDKTSVTLYDCTKIGGEGMERVMDMCPAVEALEFGYCGRMNDGHVLGFAARLGHLTSVSFDGAFLVSDQAWARFFRAVGVRLMSFKVRWAGFGIEAMRALITHCTELRELRISECNHFDDDCLALLRPMGKLQSLDLARPHKAMRSQTAARVIRTLGHQLQLLDVSGFKDLRDEFLVEVLADRCQSLQELYMGECNGLSPEAFVEFFSKCRSRQNVAGKGFTRLGFDRCYMLTNSVIQEVVLHSGASLISLSLNSFKDGDDEPELEEKTLGCPYLTDVDLSWVRCTTDNVLDEVVGSCKRLAQIRVYGCPHVTQFAPVRPGLKYIGRESDTL
ncbi:RNI-like protein [Martensiomyces pterosporus]|nr:RNI-like protein [Martensiomyces pterosporus]